MLVGAHLLFGHDRLGLHLGRLRHKRAMDVQALDGFERDLPSHDGDIALWTGRHRRVTMRPPATGERVGPCNVPCAIVGGRARRSRRMARSRATIVSTWWLAADAKTVFVLVSREKP